MTVQTTTIQRSHRGNREVYTAVGVKAGTKILGGMLACRAAAEDVAQPAADTAGFVFLGMAVDELDNTNGADGVVDPSRPERTIRTTDGEYAYPVDGADPLPGQAALVFDASTVSADATVNSIKCGQFTRPGPWAGWWFVRLDRAWA